MICGGVWWLTQLPSPLFSSDYSTVVLDEDGEYLRVFLNGEDQWFFPLADDQIPTKLEQAVITFEDQRFYQHWGVDLLAICRAMLQNVRNRETVSGASTITMQVARLARPKARTIVNKLIEMVQALRIELRYTKEEIMRLYLTHAPYGGNIIGYQAASLRYFGKDPEQITWAEAATLAVLPNSPGVVNPMQGRKQLEGKRNRLLKKLLDEAVIDQETYELAMAEEIPDDQIPFDLSAPHLASRLAHESAEKTIRTTIDRRIQDHVNGLAQEYMQEIQKKGIQNCAVLVVDTRTGEVKAYIGSNDFFDTEHSGQVDGVQMVRSTGSVLKPFLYGLAIDEGMILPQSIIKDIPMSYGAYTPYNANGKFQGVVTVKDALVQSLNAPPVSLLDQYGVNEFYQFLQDAGLSSLIRTPKEYGLPIILGGAEASLWDLVSLYWSLGNYGRFDKVRVLVAGDAEREVLKKTKGQKEQLISPGSAYLVLDMLKDVQRPGVESFWREYDSIWRIGWKTGTSYGNRDAWAIGVSPDWTIGVWVGNFNGKENNLLTGLDMSAPLLFRIFNALEKDITHPWFEKPDDLVRIKVSARTGYRLRDDVMSLGEVMEVDAPATAKPLRYSPFEKLIFVNGEETEEVCSLCWDLGDVDEILKVVYPPEVIAYLKTKGNNSYTIPPHRTSCPTVSNQNPIDFIYPQEGSVILIPRGINGEYERVTFKVAHSHMDSQLFWYLDEGYLGSTDDQHQLVMSLESGWHRLHVVDGEGHHREVGFYVDRK